MSSFWHSDNLADGEYTRVQPPHSTCVLQPLVTAETVLGNLALCEEPALCPTPPPPQTLESSFQIPLSPHFHSIPGCHSSRVVRVRCVLLGAHCLLPAG